MNFIITKDEFLAAKSAWTQPGYHHDAADHIIYNAIRGHALDRGFSPITDERKLQGSADPMRTFKDAKTNAKWALRETPEYLNDNPERKARREAENATRLANLGTKFGVVFTPELLITLRELLA